MKTTHLLLTIVPFIVAACAATPAQQSQINGLASAVAPLVRSYAQTGSVSYAQAIPVALNSLAVFDPAAAVDTAQLAFTIETAVNASTNNTGASTGQKIAAAVLGALPANPSGAQVNAALTQAGLGAGNGANQ